MDSLFTPPGCNHDEDRLQLVKRCTVPVIALATALAVGISILCLNLGYSIVFPHIYYLPIIITCVFFPVWGFFYTTGLSVLYLALVILITGDTDLLGPAIVRVFCFEAVGFVIVKLAKRKNAVETALILQRENLACIVQSQTEALSKELQQSKRLETAYRESCEFYEQIMNQNQVPMVIWNSGLYITKTNHAFELLVGRPKPDLIGRKISAVISIEEAEQKVYSVSVVIPVKRSDGRTHQIAWTISNVYTDDPADPSAVIAIGQEIPLPLAAIDDGVSAFPEKTSLS